MAPSFLLRVWFVSFHVSPKAKGKVPSAFCGVVDEAEALDPAPSSPSAPPLWQRQLNLACGMAGWSEYELG